MEREPEPAALSRRLLDLARSLRDGADPSTLDAELATLAALDPSTVDGDANRTALWLNLYNARLLHALALSPKRGHLIRHRRMFRHTAYVVGGRSYSLDAIEHGVLRRNRRPPMSIRPVLARSDPRLAASPRAVDPRIHFALNCGAASCPRIRPYAGGRLDEELAAATRSYFATEARTDRDRAELVLPALMRLYRTDFGSRAEQVRFASAHLPSADAGWLQANAGAVRVRYGGFDWTMDPGALATADPVS